MPPANSIVRGGTSFRGGRGRGQPSSTRGPIDLREYLYGKTPASTVEKGETSSSSSSKAIPSIKEVVANEPVYVTKANRQNIIEINLEDYSINNPKALFERYLGNNPFPHEASLTRETYEKILIQLKCVTFEHTKDDATSIILYSKCIVQKIIHHKEWGLNPFQEKTIFLTANLQNKIAVNYWTYVNAMMKVLFLTNPLHKHSWFIIVTKDAVDKDIPTWFYRWWSYFGANLEILPESLKNSYTEWVEASPKMRSISPKKLIQDQNLVYFFTDCQIPWVWTWSITLGKDTANQLCLQRIFLLKWWNRLNIDEKLHQIKTIIQNYKTALPSSSTPVHDEISVKDIYEGLRKKYPHKPDKWI